MNELPSCLKEIYSCKHSTSLQRKGNSFVGTINTYLAKFSFPKKECTIIVKLIIASRILFLQHTLGREYLGWLARRSSSCSVVISGGGYCSSSLSLTRATGPWLSMVRRLRCHVMIEYNNEGSDANISSKRGCK